jgi:hypothetical protein
MTDKWAAFLEATAAAAEAADELTRELDDGSGMPTSAAAELRAERDRLSTLADEAWDAFVQGDPPWPAGMPRCPFCGCATGYIPVQGWGCLLVECCVDRGGCGARGPWRDSVSEAVAEWRKVCERASVVIKHCDGRVRGVLANTSAIDVLLVDDSECPADMSPAEVAETMAEIAANHRVELPVDTPWVADAL